MRRSEYRQLERERQRQRQQLQEKEQDQRQARRQRRKAVPRYVPEPVVKEQRTPLPAAPTVESEQSGSKKRARNKKSSLQSMLADKKSTEQKKGPGLGLMDFMKT